MNIDQVEWAMQHDWYIDNHSTETKGQYVVVVRDYESEPDGKGGIMHRDVHNTFGDFKALREWAGY